MSQPAHHQINSQLTPRAAIQPARRGLGDFNSNISNPDYAAAWAPVGAQLKAEGASPGDILGAQSSFESAFSGLANSLGGSGALQAAKQYVMTGQTALGTLSQVVGLIQAGQSGEPPAGLLEGFTGTMIGVLAGAGAVSAGAGAAIIAGADIVISLLSQAGLFGSPAHGTNVCGSTVSGSTPQYLMPAPTLYSAGNCIAVWEPYWDSTHNTTTIAPGSKAWRHFPNVGNQSGGPLSILTGADSIWFAPTIKGGAQTQGLQWSWTPAGATEGVGYLGSASNLVPFGKSIRYIDLAFPVYHHMECENLASATQVVIPGDAGVYAQFQVAFFAALKLNWSYALNGIQPQPDYKVLINTCRAWNRSHAAGTGVDLQPSTSTPLNPWDDCFGTPYEQICAQAAQGMSPIPGDAAWGSSGMLHVNTGPKKSVTDTTKGSIRIGRTGISLDPRSFGASAPSSAASSSSLLTGAAVAAGALALGTYLYARHKHVPVKTVVKSAWKKTGGRVHLPHHLHLPKLGRHHR